MNTIESYRKQCMQQQTRLRDFMEDGGQNEAAIQLFMKQHAMLHSAMVSAGAEWSFEDAALGGLAESQYRVTTKNYPHSIAWLIWHIARCEDITMNMLVAGTQQVLVAGGWFEKMGVAAKDTGNEMSQEELDSFNQAIKVDALRGYRLAVGLRTHQIVKELSPGDLNRKVDPARIHTVLADGAVLPAASYVSDYLSKRTVAGLLLMPATRHNITHLSEILEIKKKISQGSNKSPASTTERMLPR